VEKRNEEKKAANETVSKRFPKTTQLFSIKWKY